MLNNFSDDQISKALKDMKVEDNNWMRQEFVEGLRGGKPGNYFALRAFLNILQIDSENITNIKITESLQNTGWTAINKMREEIFKGVTTLEHKGYKEFRKFLNNLEGEAKNV